jgi:hypothetical protein
MNKIDLDIQQASRYFTYSEYKKLVVELFDKEQVTGPNQVTSLIESTKMSIQRMKKWDKIFKLSEEAIHSLSQLEDSWTWYVITEGWCGDAAQILPVVNKMSDYTDKIELKLLLRDENSEIMANYLTNGGMAIPVLVAVNNRTGEELPHWGPRPEAIKIKLAQFIQDNPELSKAEISRELHLWYAKDKGLATQQSLLELVEEHMIEPNIELHRVG